MGMSGLVNFQQTADLQNLNIDTILSKPFSSEKLLAAVAEMIGKTKQA
jgi:DNA-binding response OmpR family regulator